MKTLHSMLKRMFFRQALAQCEYVILAHNEILSGLHGDDPRKVFFNIQNLLNAAANISKTLWGTNNPTDKHTARKRKPIRDVIGVSDKSPLRTVRMRNNFEHLDERIDEWWAELIQHNFIDFCLGDPTDILETTAIDVFRMFNDATGVLHFWGQTFNVIDILDEVKRILPKLQEEAAKPHEMVELKSPMA